MSEPDLSQVQRVLAELGLTSYEAKAYAALVQRGSYAAAELARQAGVPRQRIYDVVDGLVQRGLARQHSGAVVSYTATDPRVALDGLLTRHRRDLDALCERADEATEALATVWATGQQEQTLSLT